MTIMIIPLEPDHNDGFVEHLYHCLQTFDDETRSTIEK